MIPVVRFSSPHPQQTPPHRERGEGSLNPEKKEGGRREEKSESNWRAHEKKEKTKKKIRRLGEGGSGDDLPPKTREKGSSPRYRVMKEGRFKADGG